jgi:hypothetical protein
MMNIEDFKTITQLEPVLVHTTKRSGKKKRRLTIAATVIDDQLLIARAICHSVDDQFKKQTGMSRALGRLTSAVKYHKNKRKFAKHVTKRYKGLVEKVSYSTDYDRKQVLQCIEYIK